MSALGDAFRTAREARGLTLSDVAEHIHIRSVYLGAIEDEDWSSIGAPVYVRGFIRTYARYLGIDAEDAVARFSEEQGASAPLHPASTALPVPNQSVTTQRSSARGGPSVWAVAGVIVAIMLVGFVGYEYYQYQSGNGGAALPPAAVSSTAPNAAATAPALATGKATRDGEASGAPPSDGASASPVAAKDSIAVHLTERSWLRVVVDGTVAMEGIFPAGTMRSFAGKNASVRAGNAGGVAISVGGKNVGRMGAAGDVVERSFTLQ